MTAMLAEAERPDYDQSTLAKLIAKSMNTIKEEAMHVQSKSL